MGEEFVYQMGGVSNRRREVLFDQQNGTIRSLKKEEWTEHPWSPDVLDRLSQQEQMRLKLLGSETPPERISLYIIDGPRIKLKRFDLVETGALITSVGTLNTVHYTLRHDDPSERSSDAWLATDHDFLMVRTEHVEDGSKTVIEIQVPRWKAALSKEPDSWPTLITRAFHAIYGRSPDDDPKGPTQVQDRVSGSLGRFYARGKVTPRCPRYLPPRSA